jgi:dihydrofolate reductase
MKFIGIIAMAKNRVIGLNNDLPWGKTYKEDMKFFRQTTTGGHVILGRKTWEGLGVPYLNNRLIWVMTRQNYGWLQMMDKNGEPKVNILSDTNALPDGNYFVAGGKSIYEHFMPLITEFFVTYINKDYEGDTVMPEFENNFPNSEVVITNENFEIKKLWK